MRSRVVDPWRVLRVALLLCAGVLGACIIGPKQDDPESSLTGSPPEGNDAASSDTSGGGLEVDSGMRNDATIADTGAATDTGVAADTGASSDSATDATAEVGDASSDAAETGDTGEAGADALTGD